MSLEDDTENGEVELRELVTQTLEENGVLAKIKAQLRAGLYLALENDINTGNSDYNDFLKSKLKNPDIRIIFSLVREFLEYFELNFTCSVFEKESLMGASYEYKNREKLIQELDIGIDALHNSPLLLEILNVARSSFNLSVRDIKFNSTENKNTTYDLIHDKSGDSNTTDTFQHVINIKTVPKDKDTNNDKDNLNETENIAQSVCEENATEQSVVVVSENAKNKHELLDDDTYEGTSSIAEDSVSNREQTALIDFDKSIKIPLVNNSSPTAATKHIIDQTIDDNNKSPRISEHSSSSEKKKQDKTLKPMSALSSLSDLPPIQLNKSRNSDTVLLPSLYSKREKSGMKDFDKLFDTSYDSLDNYEEDFLSSTSLDDGNIFIPAAQISNKFNTNTNTKIEDRPVKLIDNMKSEEGSKETNKTHESNGSNTTISEDFDINSNCDDILKSENST